MISLTVPKGHINNILALVQIWTNAGKLADAYICVTRRQWVNVQISAAKSAKPAKIGSDSCTDPTPRIT